MFTRVGVVRLELANKTLVPTHKGDAPLLAAQR